MFSGGYKSPNQAKFGVYDRERVKKIQSARFGRELTPYAQMDFGSRDLIRTLPDRDLVFPGPTTRARVTLERISKRQDKSSNAKAKRDSDAAELKRLRAFEREVRGGR